MKTHNLFYRARIILEAEDDLFPGIGSSDLDELTPRDQRPVPGEDMESLQDTYNELDELQHIHILRYQRLEQYLEDNDALNDIIYSPLQADNIPYESFAWLSKYENVQRFLDSNYSVSKHSPLFKNIEKQIRNLNGIQIRIDDFRDKEREVIKKINKIQNAERKAVSAKKKAGVDVSVKAFAAFAKTAPQIPAPSPIPSKVRSSSGSTVANPYVHAGAAKQYAGHVAHYPHWSGYWKDQIVQVVDMLKRNGKGGLEMMYAGTHQQGGGRFNFIITGANGKLTWRKYDPSPGAGQNWIILAGKKMNTSKLLSADQATQDKLIQTL